MVHLNFGLTNWRKKKHDLPSSTLRWKLIFSGFHRNLRVNRAGDTSEPVVSQAAIRHNRSLRSLLFHLPFDDRQNLM